MKKAAIILLALVLSVPAFAQGKFGADSAECIKYLSYYSEYMKQNNIAEATPAWRKAMSLCPPSANQNMLINGQKILRREISLNQKDPVRRQELLDSLLWLHDLRAEVYPKYAITSYNNKAIDIINYYKAEKKKGYDLLKPVVATVGAASSPAVFVNYMQFSVDLYKNGILMPDEVMANYTEIVEYMDQSTAKDIAPARANVEQLLIDSGVASCDNLIALFTPRYEANPADKALLANMVKMLATSDCVDTDLYLKAVESLNEVDPSPQSAYYLYKLYSARDDNAAAAKALSGAIDQLDATNPDDLLRIADYKLELATFTFKKLGRSADAVALAKQVPDVNPNLAGKAYFLIGTVWGSQKCSGNEVEVRAPYWVAVDYMRKAKEADPTLEAEANNLIAQYSRYFPNSADAFMYDVVDGNVYTVNCGGMREATRVRTIK